MPYFGIVCFCTEPEAFHAAPERSTAAGTDMEPMAKQEPSAGPAGSQP